MFKIWIALLFSLLLTYAINNSVTAGVTAEDWNRHSVWIQSWIDGVPVPMSVYPPAFHFFMIPAVMLLGDYIAYFQIVLAAMVNFSLLFIVHKYHGETATLAMAVLMLSNLCFLIYYDSLTPQTLDVVLFPFFFIFLKKNNFWPAVAILLFIGYSHNFGIIFLLIASVYSLMFKREFIKFLMLSYILLIPMFYYTYLPLTYNVIFNTDLIRAPIDNWKVVGYEIWATRETLFFEQPLNLLAFTGFTFPMLFFVAWRFNKTRKLSDAQKFYLVWIALFIPVLYFSIWRAMSFLVVPIMLLEASFIGEKFEI